MIEFLSNLFDTSDFPARWHCGRWTEVHGWTHIISDIAISAAYSMIPLALAGFWWVKRSELAFPRLFWLFAAFILSCGTTHLVEAVIFYHPVYRFAALMKVITALVSWATVIALLRAIPQALELPGLRKVNTKLEEQLARNREVEEQLRRSNHDLEEFTGIVTHDLRNPMGGAVFAAEMVKESLEAGKDEAAKAQLALVLESLRRMDNLVKELHADSLLRGQAQGAGDVPLDGVVELVRNNLSRLCEECGATIESDGLPVVRGNRMLLVQLFTNLIENAVKYRAENPPRIRISAHADGLQQRISVADNGRGVPDADRERIFEPKERGGNVAGEAGSGLGLAFCRRIMRDHGGTIAVTGNSQGGSTFELRFPARN